MAEPSPPTPAGELADSTSSLVPDSPEFDVDAPDTYEVLSTDPTPGQAVAEVESEDLTPEPEEWLEQRDTL